METLLSMTPAATDRLHMLLAEEQKLTGGLRLYVQGGGCSGFQYGMMLEEAPGAADTVITINDVALYIDPVSVSYLKGAHVDFVESITGGGFTISNPNATTTCGCGSSFAV